ncbi:MAG: flavodoxin domain-containing protein [Lachnospiraceae bacterium]|nr:flavodoxin domain-containing protein [Lachnospiraceae bacterium]
MAVNKVLIVYYSKTGFTKKYAEWIEESLSEGLSCDVFSYSKRRKIQLSQYDIILFGGGFHAGQINGIKWFKTQMHKLSDNANRRIAVFATGAMPAEAPDIEKALRQNFTEEEWAKITAFYLPGGLCYEKMGVGDRLMMAAFRALLKEKNVDSQMQQIVAHSFDLTSKELITPLVEWCVSFRSK